MDCLVVQKLFPSCLICGLSSCLKAVSKLLYLCIVQLSICCVVTVFNQWIGQLSKRCVVTVYNLWIVQLSRSCVVTVYNLWIVYLSRSCVVTVYNLWIVQLSRSCVVTVYNLWIVQLSRSCVPAVIIKPETLSESKQIITNAGNPYKNIYEPINPSRNTRMHAQPQPQTRSFRHMEKKFHKTFIMTNLRKYFAIILRVIIYCVDGDQKTNSLQNIAKYLVDLNSIEIKFTKCFL